MTLADSLKAILPGIRAIPGQLGVHVHSASVVIASTSGTYTGDGTRTETVTALTHANGQNPHISWADDKDVAMGLVPRGQVTIAWLTPSDALRALLLDDPPEGYVRLIRITGPRHPNGADYRITDVKTEKALHWDITAEPVGKQA